MIDKYFTPDISDIRVGYEYEYFLGDEWHKGEVLDLYTDRHGCGLGEVQQYLEKGNLKVPYLTKEQIVAEGWEDLIVIDNFGSFEATKNKSGIVYTLTWTGDLQLQITETNSGHCVFHGECKDINTFRYICKLLNI